MCCPKCPKVWVYADKLEDGNNLRCKECYELFPEDYVPKHLLPKLRALQEADRGKKTSAPESFDISSDGDAAVETDDLSNDQRKDRIKELQSIKTFCREKGMDFPDESELELSKLLQQDVDDQKIPTTNKLHKEYQKLDKEAKQARENVTKMQSEIQLLQQRLEDARTLAEKGEKEAQDKRKAAADAFDKYTKAKKKDDEKEMPPQPKPEASNDPGIGQAEKAESDELRKQLADREKRITEMEAKFLDMEKMFSEYKASASTPQRKKEDENAQEEAKGGGGEQESEEEDEEEEEDEDMPPPEPEPSKRTASPNRFQTGASKSKKSKKK